MTQDQREGYRFTRGMNDLTKSENLSRIDEPTGEVYISMFGNNRQRFC